MKAETIGTREKEEPYKSHVPWAQEEVVGNSADSGEVTAGKLSASLFSQAEWVALLQGSTCRAAVQGAGSSMGPTAALREP